MKPIVIFLLVLTLFNLPALAALAPGKSSDLVATTYAFCKKRKCTFATGSNEYIVKRKRVELASGRSLTFNDRGDQILGSTLSGTGNVLALSIANTTISRRGFGGTSGPSLARPDDFDKSFRVELYNPKSGSLIKSFDLGAFASDKIGLSDDGSFLFVSGGDLERREVKEARVYNARNGRIEMSAPEAKPSKVTMASNGFQLTSGEVFRLQTTAEVSGKQVYHSRDPFSIAEFEVECTKFVGQFETISARIGVANFGDGVSNQGALFASAVSSTFGSKNYRMVERGNLQNVLEEIQLSMSGLTESDIALDVGRLGVATHMIFGSASRAGSNVSFSTRLVSVETGEQNTSCIMICRECSNQDLFEAVNSLAEHWVGTLAR